jgi:hypothetical protein
VAAWCNPVAQRDSAFAFGEKSSRDQGINPRSDQLLALFADPRRYTDKVGLLTRVTRVNFARRSKYAVCS